MTLKFGLWLVAALLLCGCAVRRGGVPPAQTTVTTNTTFTYEAHLQNSTDSRKISLDELNRPVRLEGVPKQLSLDDRQVRCQDLVGKWECSRETATRLVDLKKMTEEVRRTEGKTVVEYHADGTCVIMGSRGTWVLAGEVLKTCCGSRSENRHLKYTKDGGLLFLMNEEDWDELRKKNVERNPVANGVDVSYSQLKYDDAYCTSFDVSHFRKGTFDELCRITIVSSPEVYYRVEELAIGKTKAVMSEDISRALSVERKKNLDSLLKAGVITEEEYKKELGKETK